MTKTSKEQQLKDAHKVFTELQKNSKEHIDIIANNCGFSKQKVSRLIKQLETEGHIWGYTAIIDEGKRGLSQFIVMIRKSSKPLNKEIMEKIDATTLEEFISDIGVIIESSCFVHGKYDWIVSIIAQDIKQAKKFCDKLYEAFPGAIEKVDVTQILYCLKKQYIFNPIQKKLKDLL